MRNYITQLSMFALLLASSASFATTASPCPEVAQIVAAGLQGVEDSIVGWAGYNSGQYGTEEMWLFGLFGIEAENEEEALQIGVSALPSLYFSFEFGSKESGYVCIYESHSSKIQAWMTTGDANAFKLGPNMPFRK